MNVNGGRTAFFGDVALYDDQFDEKMSKEGAWGVGFGIARQINYVFALEGQAMFGKLRGSNSVSEFESNINEYSLQITTDLVNLLIPVNFYGGGMWCGVGGCSVGGTATAIAQGAFTGGLVVAF